MNLYYYSSEMTIYGFYWLTSVEINKHKIFDANNAWITEL